MASKLGVASKLLVFGYCLLLLDATCAKPSKESKDTAAAAANAEEAKKNDEFPEEDSDMLMEPNDFTPITVLRSLEQHYHAPPTTLHHHQPQQQQQPLHHEFHPIPNPQIATSRADVPPPQAFARDSHTQAAQNFYPPFFREAPPLGHSRPYFPTPDGPPIPKYAAPQPEAASAAPGPRNGFDPAILGSGDFGVIRGGTFYPDEEMPYHPEENSDQFNQFYGDGNNGHGRPSNEGFIQKYTYPEEQFANFRDFADINTPADSAFSQFVVVYAAKNSTAPGSASHPRPKNIFEQLELLDREKALEEKKAARSASKSKSKLSKTKLQKNYKKKTSPKDLDYEPLLALS